MKDLDETAMAMLAREMAMNIRNYKVIFDEFGITEEEYYEISKIDFFKRAKEQFSIEWNSALSTVDRTRLKAAAGTEELMGPLIQRALRETEPLAACIETAKWASKIAGLGEGAAEAPKSDRFVIQINMGSDVELIDKPIAVGVDNTPPKVIETKAEETVVTSIPEVTRRGRPPGSKNNPKTTYAE